MKVSEVMTREVQTVRPDQPVQQAASFMLSRAKDVGVTEHQILQLLGFRGAVGPLETLLSGRPPTETIPEIAAGIKEGTDEVLKITKAQVESAIPVVTMDQLKPLIRKMGMLSDEGVKNLDVHRVEFRVAQTDLRPVVRLDDATGTSFDSVKFPRTADTPVFVLKDVTGFEIHRSAGLPETARTDKIADEKL